MVIGRYDEIMLCGSRTVRCSTNFHAWPRKLAVTTNQAMGDSRKVTRHTT